MSHVPNDCCQFTPSFKYHSCPSMAYRELGLTWRVPFWEDPEAEVTGVLVLGADENGLAT